MKVSILDENGRCMQLMDLATEEDVILNMNMLGGVAWSRLPDDFNIFGDYPTLNDKLRGPLPGHKLYEES